MYLLYCNKKNTRNEETRVEQKELGSHGGDRGTPPASHRWPLQLDKVKVMAREKLRVSHIPAGPGGPGTGQPSRPVSHLLHHPPCGAATAVPPSQVQEVRNWSKPGAEVEFGPGRLPTSWVARVMVQ